MEGNDRKNITQVVHCMVDEYDIYIGRGIDKRTGKLSIYGNPYSHKDGTRARYKVDTAEKALELYEAFVRASPSIISSLPELRGQRLGCWCKTKNNRNALCHGDILIKLLYEFYGEGE